ncbi:hypothetical protein CCH79_00001505 [Gambusia affinis]|uniref:Uncharacterized protein n=1 Tax=Gambusia affinis TaxID=33528 RepID=A0A315VQ66_GAMAF|nr:hypothetical protein CCH79_00001505 [Gambusia affinis]
MMKIIKANWISLKLWRGDLPSHHHGDSSFPASELCRLPSLSVEPHLLQVAGSFPSSGASVSLQEAGTPRFLFLLMFCKRLGIRKSESPTDNNITWGEELSDKHKKKKIIIGTP